MKVLRGLLLTQQNARPGFDRFERNAIGGVETSCIHRATGARRMQGNELGFEICVVV